MNSTKYTNTNGSHIGNYSKKENYSEQTPDTNIRTRNIYPQGFCSQIREMLSSAYENARYLN